MRKCFSSNARRSNEAAASGSLRVRLLLCLLRDTLDNTAPSGVIRQPAHRVAAWLVLSAGVTRPDDRFDLGPRRTARHRNGDGAFVPVFAEVRAVPWVEVWAARRGGRLIEIARTRRHVLRLPARQFGAVAFFTRAVDRSGNREPRLRPAP